MSSSEISSNDHSPINTSIAPWLTVSNCSDAVNFYKLAFAALEVYKLESPDRVLQVAKLSVDGAEFWLGAGTGNENSSTSESTEEVPVRMILTVTDPDALFAKALKAGATEIFAVGEEYGWRLGRLADPFGFHWEIGRPLS